MSNSLYYYKTSLNFIDGIKIHVVRKENHTTISQLTDVSRIESLKNKYNWNTSPEKSPSAALLHIDI